MSTWWVVGTGRAGSGIGRALVAAGERVTWVSRRPNPEPCGVEVRPGQSHCVDWGSFAPVSGDRVMVCVPDGVVTRAARALDASLCNDQAPVWLHAAGSLAPEALQGAVRGPAGGAHPLFPFGPANGETPDLRGAVIGLDGAPEAIEAGRALARLVGAHAVVVPSGARAAWHLSAVLASNGVYALQEAARHALDRAGIRAAEVVPGLALLARASADSVLCRGLDAALTGPVARGDASTITRHRQWLAEAAPELGPLYSELAQLLLAVAERRGLGPSQVAAIAQAIFGEVPPDRD